MLIHHCTLQVPDLGTWLYAISVHGGLCLVGGVSLGVLSYYYCRGRRAVSLILATFQAVSVALLSICYLQYRHPQEILPFDYHPWIGPFLASTFGFATFFKLVNAGFQQFPAGADQDLTTWLLWFVLLPEPQFAKEKLIAMPLEKGRQMLQRRLLSVLAKICGLFLLLTLLLWSSSNHQQADLSNKYQVQLPFPLDSSELAHTTVNGVLHIWFIYLFASFCLDFGLLANTALTAPLVSSSGSVGGSGSALIVFQSGFHNPLLQSRSLKDAWGIRWNKPTQQLLQRTSYIPLRRQGFGRIVAAMCTFVTSGLLHEYNFGVHNHSGYQPGLATVFFVIMGAIMLAEQWVWDRLVPMSVKDIINRQVPSFLVSITLTLIAAVPFEHYFITSWLDAGAVACAAQLFPHVLCAA